MSSGDERVVLFPHHPRMRVLEMIYFWWSRFQKCKEL